MLKFSSLFQQLYNKKPYYNFLKACVCACYSLLKPYNKHKLNFRFDLCLFLSYSSQHKGYKCLSKNGRLCISRNVIFDETLFPYLTNFSPISTPPTSQAHSIPCIPLVPKSVVQPSLKTIVQPTASPLNAPLADSQPCVSIPLSTTNATNNDRSPAITNSSNLAPFSLDSSIENTTLAVLPQPKPQTGASKYARALISQHTMTTRDKVGIFKPKVYTASLLPSLVKKALADPHWLTAMQEEYTGTLMPLLHGRSSIGCKWLFVVKYNFNGSLNKYKARLVVKGFHQRTGRFDFHESFNPMVKQQTIRIVLTMALSNKWPIRQIDFKNAFLNGDLEEFVFMTQPEGFSQGDSHLICKLNKTLYGLKQTPRAWFNKLQNAFISLGFASTKCDSSLFVKVTSHYTLYDLVYVDDVLIIGSFQHAISILI